MRRSLAVLAMAALLHGAVSAQNTGYRADISLESINIEAPGVNPQASEVIVPVKTNCTVVIVVQNKSDRILDGYQLQVMCANRMIGSESQGTFRPGETKTHRIRYVADQSGRFGVEAKITPKAGALAGEDNPRNNQAGIGLTVEGPGNTAAGGSLPDLIFDGASSSNVAALGKTIVEIRIGNRGGTDVKVPVELEVEAAGQKFRARTTSGIPAGKTGFATVEIIKDRWDRNPHGTVIIDPNHAVKESSATNNKGTF